MREIIFRGKRIGNGEWVEGFYVHENTTTLKTEHHVIFSGNNDYRDQTGSDRYESWWVDPDTVGQYTGLKDKNGKRIFEGDIIQFSYTGKNKGVEGRAAVIFGNGAFGVAWGWHKEFVRIDGFANTTLEIIGNIHDELIGGNDA